MKITKESLIIAGRILFGLVLLTFSYGHFFNANMMTDYVPKFFPNPIYWIYFTGACFIVAGISIIINKGAWAAGVGVAVMLGVFIATIHFPATLSGNAMAITNLLKDAAIAAGALIIAGLDPSLDNILGKEKSNQITHKKKKR